MKKTFLGLVVALITTTLALLDASYRFLGDLFNYILPCNQAATSAASCTDSYDAVFVVILAVVALGSLLYAYGNLLSLGRTVRERRRSR